LRDTAALRQLQLLPSVFIRVHSWLKTKNPTAVWQWGSINFVTQSEPDRRAAQPPRVQQQVQIQITIHDGKVTITSGHVKWFLICVFRESVGVCRRRASGNITVRKVMLDEDSRAH